MGSDMYMAEKSFRPRPNKAEWDGDDLVIYTDRFDGFNGIFKEFWRGPVTDSNRGLILKMVGIIPDKPPKAITPLDKVVSLLLDCGYTNSKNAAWVLANQIDKFYKEK